MAKKIMSKKEMLKEQNRIKQERRMLREDYKSEDVLKNLIIITIVVVIFLAISYFGINILKGKIKLGKNDLVIDDTIENGVICGTIFNQYDNEYYVLAYNHNGDDKDVYKSLVNNYNGYYTLYNMDLDSAFNKSCLSDKTSVSDDIEKLKISSPTLLHIVNQHIEKAYTTKADIMKILLEE